MDQIAFKNFRRFEEFTPMDLGGINIFVGKNSSGKSTVIKAIILGIESIARLLQNNMQMGYISFAPQGIAHLNLGNFYSNLRSGSNSKSMEFSYIVGDVKIEIELDGSSIQEGSPSVLIPIKHMTVNHLVLQAGYSYDRINDEKYTTTFIGSWENIIKYYRDKLDVERGHLTSSENIIPYFERQEEHFFPTSDNRDLKRQNERRLLREMDNRDGSIRGIQAIEVLLHQIEENSGKCVVSWEEKVHDGGRGNDRSLKTPSENRTYEELRSYWIDLKKKLRESVEENLPHYQYIETHIASHNELLFSEDKNNYLANTVIWYINSKVNQNDKAKDFIKKWLKEFEIADDFKIEQPFGEAYRVVVQKDGSNRPLGSLGTGSIQMFILLLQMASAFNGGEKRTIFIEEPEQNLHPAFQSKLADLFWDLYQVSMRRIQLVIETHSEYLVRRTQVIAKKTVLEGQLIDNINDCMKVYYFNENEPPTSMNYLPSGYFENKFGPGFYDTAGDSFLELLDD